MQPGENERSQDRKEAMRRRTKAFASAVVRTYVHLDKHREEQAIVGRQFLRAGTSVAANYREASRARSRAEFVAKIELCAQEADEAQLWLELLAEECGVARDRLEPVWSEAEELISIFVTMSRNAKRRTGELLRPETGVGKPET